MVGKRLGQSPLAGSEPTWFSFRVWANVIRILPAALGAVLTLCIPFDVQRSTFNVNTRLVRDVVKGGDNIVEKVSFKFAID